MIKNLIILILLFLSYSLSAQTPVTFDRFSLDDDKTETIRIIEREYEYEIDEYGGYVVTIDSKTDVEIYFEGERIRFLTVVKKESEYTDFIELIRILIDQHGEPRGTYESDDEYNVYWWAQNPSFDLRVTISLDQPFIIREMVFYGA